MKKQTKKPEQKEEKKIFYKVILIGDSLVGKTCLFKKITKGIYTNKNISTIGMDQKTLSMKIKVQEKDSPTEVEKDFTINLWDTAGQERFRSITSGYFKESHGLILLYDITNRNSFDNLEKWMESVNETLGSSNNDNHKKYALILLGNKADLEDKRKVTYEEAEDKCKKYNIFWGGECSVQEMSLEDLNDKFYDIIKEVYKVVGICEDKKPIIKKLSSHNKNKKKNDSDCLC